MVALLERIHEGLVWSNRDKRTLLDKMLGLLDILAIKAPFYFVADAYYAAGKMANGPLLSAIGIAGMDRLVRFNVLAMSGRAVEAAGDADTLLLDKTGTITLGNRQATEFKPLRGVTEQELADAAQLASLADETPEGRSIVVLAKEKHGIRGRDLAELQANFIPFTAQSRMSGVEVGGSWVRKGAVDSILNFLNAAAPTVAGAGATARMLQPMVNAETVREVQAITTPLRSLAALPSRLLRTGNCLASFTSRISSRVASASALPSFAEWAYVPS
jgi:hypothetical protein